MKWEQLREKRLIQILASYIAGGWVLLQVTDQLVERSLLPEIAYLVCLIWFAAGIPAAVLIGWHHGEKGDQRASRSETLSLATLALIAMLGSGFAVRHDRGNQRLLAAQEDVIDLRNVAVMYLEDDTDNPELAYLADGLTEDLISSLRRVNELDVRSKNATLPFRRADVPLDSIAAELDVGTIVSGSVQQREGRIAVVLELVDGNSGAVVNRTKIEQPASDLMAVRADMVEQSVTLLRQWIGKELRLRRSAQGTSVPEAWALVQRAERARKDAEEAVRRGGPAAGEPTFRRAIRFLENARLLDPAWPEPAVQLAAITYRRSRLTAAAGELASASGFIEQGLQRTEEALRLDKDEPRALELRGTLQYFKWLLNQTPDKKERDRLLVNARADLERAVALDNSLASAYSTLSHLLYNEDITSAVLAAKQAYAADAYVEIAGDVIWRLFYGNFDLENLTQAREWCNKGKQRFPDDYRWTYCELRLLATPSMPPDINRAWQLFARMDSIVPAPRRGFEMARAELAVGGVLARAGLPDSARAVMMRGRAKINPQIDPGYDLLWFEAAMRLFLNERDEALGLLKRAVLANPDQGFKAGEPVHWLYRDLQQHPGFDVLYTGG